MTAILPRRKDSRDQCFAAWFTLNGNGEMTGTTWIQESGFLEGLVMITNTHSIGVARDAVIAWQMQRQGKTFQPRSLPVVAETWDGSLNDINGFHVESENVFQALNGAKSGLIAEVNVGGGTRMVAHRFKGGTGTASRKLDARSGGYTVGVLVQANFGRGENSSGDIFVAFSTANPGASGDSALPHERLKEILKKYNRLNVN